MCNLQEILPQLSTPHPLPTTLPLIHVSKSGRSGFLEIINNTMLMPRYCQVFNQPILYFSYGNVFYETGNSPTRNQTKLPICFLFNPLILSEINSYYPYDTGAAKFQKYGRHSEHLSNNLERYRVNGNDNQTPQKLVFYIYQSNQNYRRGVLNSSMHAMLTEAYPELFAFLQDSNIEGCDERQYTIECQTIRNIDLQNFLEWIAFPESYTDLFVQLFNQMQPHPPVRYPYEHGTVFHPQKILGAIREKANEYIQTRYSEM